ncbi:MAG: DUF3570 domain-containing protein [Sideroxydans sp.]
MAVINRKATRRYFKGSFSLLISFMVRLAHHERNQHHWVQRLTVRPEPVEGLKSFLKKPDCASLHALTAAALILPGLLPTSASAGEDDQLKFGYQYYEEGYRPGVDPNPITGPHTKKPPIIAESITGTGSFSLTDRIKFAFNFLQDTWSGATPESTLPLASAHRDFISGASANLSPNLFYIGRDGNYYGDTNSDGIIDRDNRVTHLYTYASPETRQQADFKLAYQGDDMRFGIGGGLSAERDYHSTFVNASVGWDFNRKLTAVDLGLSYTRSDIGNNLTRFTVEHTPRSHSYDPDSIAILDGAEFAADREDWGVNLGISHILNKTAVLHGGLAYTRSTGFLENPYKVVSLYSVDDTFQLVDGRELKLARYEDVYEQRPDSRNQFTWSLGIVQHIRPLDAALHLDYRFFHDDWGISAHTFEGAFDQPVGRGWTLTPRIRYYSQTAADFYQPYFLLGPEAFVRDSTNPRGFQLDFSKLPITEFSSDHRLSEYGTLSGGLTISKQFAKGLTFSVSGEYYQHAGSLALDGKGEGSYADFDSFNINAALNVNLAALSLPRGGTPDGMAHIGHGQHGNPPPAGVMFGHTLDKAGDMMVGYRFLFGSDRGNLLHGTTAVPDDQTLVDNGCPGAIGCSFVPTTMQMNMHMLEMMYAPTDWLTLMLMPQFMDMGMKLRELDNPPPVSGHNHGNSDGHVTAGIGDTGIYALTKLFDNSTHHLHLGLGFSAPTGSVTEKQHTKSSESDDVFL